MCPVVTLAAKILSKMLKTLSQFSRRKRYSYVNVFLLLSVFLFFLSFDRIFTFFIHLFELDYYAAYSWPLNVDIKQCVRNLKTKKRSECSVINSYNYSFISSCENMCRTESNNLILVYVVKSKSGHFERRSAIRESWGLDPRFPDVRTVFILGIEENTSDFQWKIEQESVMYGDIVQADFVDTYWNVTIKTMIGMQWVVKFCNNSKFYFFSDDDMYVSTKNVLKFVGNPFNYPEYFENHSVPSRKVRRKNIGARNWKSPKLDRSIINDPTSLDSSKNSMQVLSFELSDEVRLYAGGVSFCCHPVRNYFSKRYISLAEFPFDRCPPYVTGGCYVLSFNALSDLYFGSFFTKHFRVEDVYLGIVAKKMGLKLIDCEEFHYSEKPYNKSDYRHVIASHGYSDPGRLLRVWKEQESVGNA